MPKCALPEHIDEASEWKGTDDDTPLMRWRLKCKHWFAFSHRCPKGLAWTIVFAPGLYVLPFSIWFTGWSWWYLFPLVVIPVKKKWRDVPTCIFAIKGKGPWRLESSDGNIQVQMNTPESNVMFFPRIETSSASVMMPFYLSRVQYWSRWHFAISWPFLIQFHFYPKAADVVPTQGERRNTDGKLWFVYRGWHRDADQIFWGDGGYAGRNWK